jgi:hypothetical protein
MPQQISIIRKHLSRSEIEGEISAMIKNISALVKDNNGETIYIADGYCRFDILFDK